VRSSSRNARAVSAARVATPDEWPCSAGNFEIAHVAEHCGDVESLLRPPVLDRKRLLVEQSVTRIAAPVEDPGDVRREGLHEARVEDRPCAPAQAVDGQLGAAEVVENDSVRGDARDPGSRCDRLLAKALRHALAAPPLADLVQGALDARADCDPAGDAPSDLAARGVVLLAERGPVANETLGDLAAHARGEPARRLRDHGRRVVRRIGEIRPGRGSGDSELVAEERRGLVREARTADVKQQTGEEAVAHLGLREPVGAREPCSDEALAHRRLGRQTESEVDRDREAGEEICEPDASRHRAPILFEARRAL
jgi:hypothetical protein